MTAFSSKLPISSPVESLGKLYNWEPLNGEESLPSISLQAQTHHTRGTPRTLLCHDMDGGYLDDKFVQGVNKHDIYRFFHWTYIDIFVYFSHKFITIPPAVWIDAAHLHGVKILGTFITEWTDGAEICDAFLTDEESVEIVVKKLVDIAEHFRFDGWLINIENKIESKKMATLTKFLLLLTESIHHKIPESLIIWYDSVIFTGDLKWQNELNLKNKQFFDVCDGIYLNYNWTDEHLKNSVSLAGTRILDVYAGIDVFGRGTESGGGFKTNIALEIARQNNLSVAIFAQGWVYEKLGKDSFTKNEYKFWSLISHLLPNHGPASLPFSSSFCQGFGLKYFQHGKLLQDHPWNNLSLQQIQPTSHSFYQKEDFPYRMEIDINDPYSGGGSLAIYGMISNEKAAILQLLKSDFPLKESMLVGFVWKNTIPSPTKVCLVLTVEDSTDAHRIIHLTEDSLKNDTRHFNPKNPKTVEHLEPITAQDLQCLSLNGICDLHESKNNWEKRLYIINPGLSEKEKINLVNLEILTSSDSFNIRLGHLHIIPLSLLEVSSPLEVKCLHIETIKERNQMIITCLLRWTGGKADLVESYAIYSSMKWDNNIRTSYVGSTRKTCYKITDFVFPNPQLASHTLRFIVEEHLITGSSPVSLSSAPYVDIEF